jgi:NADPH:quinone reductase-like Zn-dependent oxidoreductase
MKAIVLTKYGSPDGLHLREVPRPTLRDGHVLIRIRASTVSMGDCEIRTMSFPLWLTIPLRLYIGVINPRSKILGQEFAGEVEAVGKDVTRFQLGDRVYGSTGLGLGAHAEYIRLPAAADKSALALIPANLSDNAAAAIPVGGLEALHFLRKAKLQRGEKTLINGAGGSIGTFAVQLAKSYGAEVTAVDSAGKHEMLRSIGADHVIDYTREDFTQRGETYDVIFDVVGKTPFVRTFNLLKPKGRYLMGNAKPTQMLRAPLLSRGTGKQIIMGAANQTSDDLLQLNALIEAGTLRVVIDRIYPLEKAAEAHAYVESGQKKGGVVLEIG